MGNRIVGKILSVVRTSVTLAVDHLRARWLLVVFTMLGLAAAPAAVAAVKSSYTPLPRVKDLSAKQLPDPSKAPGLDQTRIQGEKQARERRLRHATGTERAARNRSRSAYRGQGRSAALRVARRELAPLMSAPLWSPPKLALGEQIVGYKGDHLIQIRRPGKKVDGVIYSPFPTRVTDEKGHKRPTNLSLVESDESFATKNAPVEVLLPKRLAEGVTLGETGVSVRPPVSATMSSGVEEAGKVFWSDVATDTDFVVAPLPTGFETFHVLRSAAAPQNLDLMLDLPAGATLRRTPVERTKLGAASKADATGVEIVRNGQVVGTISPPVASDADGEPVDVRLRIGADRVTLDVPHHAADVKYPLTVDPTFTGFVRDDNTWKDGYPSFAGWQFASSPAGYFSSQAGSNFWGNGLYVGAIPNAPYCCNWTGQWTYFAPGTSYVYRADLTGMYYAHSGSTFFAGIAHASVGWQKVWTTSTAMDNAYTTICVSDCGPSGALPGNAFAFGLVMYGPTTAGGSLGYLGRAYLYLSDNDAPVITAVASGAPAGWVHPDDLDLMGPVSPRTTPAWASPPRTSSSSPHRSVRGSEFPAAIATPVARTTRTPCTPTTSAITSPTSPTACTRSQPASQTSSAERESAHPGRSRSTARRPTLTGPARCPVWPTRNYQVTATS